MASCLTAKSNSQVSQTGDNPTKITIKTVENTVKAASAAAAAANSGGVPTLEASGSQDREHGHHHHHHHHQRPSRKRKHKEFASPSGDALIHVDINDVEDNGNGASVPAVPPTASSSSSSVFSSAKTGTVQIQFDPSTKRLWQDLHYAYGNYASFLRHLILLEKYWRNGDLVLSDSASQKASGYIRSMRNRINAYEDRHKRSDAELSESTRPDLSVPPAPDCLQHLPDDDDDASSSYVKPSTSSATAAAQRPPASTAIDGSTILRIPKVPKSVPPPASASPNPPEPTKIRVRTDLMHQLGLMSNAGNVNASNLFIQT